MQTILRPLFLMLLCLMLSACATKSTSDSAAGSREASEDKLSIKSMAGQFVGILPCVDCTGWHTQLDLGADGQFRLTEQSLDEHEAKFVETTGVWSVDDGPISFIALRAQDAGDEEPRYYEVVSKTQLIFVGLDKQQIETDLDYSLSRKD